ncbi:MAG: bifunctional diguanylate cyclase/phosphodiesterase [Ruminococcus sp.]|nr:bifunctional diguanylate cyclase/phosphodiesterase [Ruminococcus sp.]
MSDLPRPIVGRNKNLERTMNRLSSGQRAPLFGYVILILLYIAGNFATTTVVRMNGQINIGEYHMTYAQFAGVFSSITNICVIMLVVYYKRLGFITSLGLLAMQFPMLIINLFVQHNPNSVPGLFTNVFTIIAIFTLRINDIRTEKIRKHMAEQAVTDRLTGLPNRFACAEVLSELVKHGERFTLVSIDINNFKGINDTMGFDIGNKLLIEIGSRWKNIADSSVTGTADFIARLNGDEFALVIRGYKTPDDIDRAVEKYEAVLGERISIDSYDLYVSASFGYAEFPTDADNIDNLFTYASAAMTEVKREHSSDHVMRFLSDLIKTEHTLMIEHKLRTALENDTIFFNLQPQFDMQHKLRGFEALARMKDEEGNIVSPGEFIPVAEKVGLVDKVDGTVFRKSAIFFGEILKSYGADITLSVNVSVRHLMKKDFVDEIRRVLEESGVSPKNLEIEITESIMIDSVDKALQVINEIEAMGIKIAIDDFGTGYSSLSYLNRFPADLLKIDKSFIDKMNSGDSPKQYVAAIIAIGHIMGFSVISEGVEEEAQIATLKEIGCDYIQGFVWGRPLPADQAEELVRQSVQA